eukprot:CAMPEP_0172480204 /NCGR_PEP_ID=MMETSP1066-20121228/5247_1 /TAXON_ID=671091 /ORGANISM="Coscinodiscus wailesii, Strain CCMP2513" /LENGTH=71 /DNA_ID=CAMNT_0013241331 /DNA_START=50 /DNA_END=262 /DNA_ORIENTATION=+
MTTSDDNQMIDFINASYIGEGVDSDSPSASIQSHPSSSCSSSMLSAASTPSMIIPPAYSKECNKSFLGDEL